MRQLKRAIVVSQELVQAFVRKRVFEKSFQHLHRKGHYMSPRFCDFDHLQGSPNGSSQHLRREAVVLVDRHRVFNQAQAGDAEIVEPSTPAPR